MNVQSTYTNALHVSWLFVRQFSLRCKHTDINRDQYRANLSCLVVKAVKIHYQVSVQQEIHIYSLRKCVSFTEVKK